MRSNPDERARRRTFSEIEAEEGTEAAIQAGIAADPDNPEWTDEDFEKARPTHTQSVSPAAEYSRGDLQNPGG